MSDPTTFNPNSWDDVCMAMVMECEPEPDGFEDPPYELAARYCRDYPHFSDDLIDFAATCRSERALLKKYPPTEPTQDEVDAAAKRAMVRFRLAMRRANRKKKTA